MSFKFNPFTGNFDEVLDSSSLGFGTGVDNRIVRWDGLSAIQSSGVTIDDSDNISGVGTFSMSGDFVSTGGDVTVPTLLSGGQINLNAGKTTYISDFGGDMYFTRGGVNAQWGGAIFSLNTGSGEFQIQNGGKLTAHTLDFSSSATDPNSLIPNNGFRIRSGVTSSIYPLLEISESASVTRTMLDINHNSGTNIFAVTQAFTTFFGTVFQVGDSGITALINHDNPTWTTSGSTGWTWDTGGAIIGDAYTFKVNSTDVFILQAGEVQCEIGDFRMGNASLAADVNLRWQTSAGTGRLYWDHSKAQLEFDSSSPVRFEGGVGFDTDPSPTTSFVRMFNNRTVAGATSGESGMNMDVLGGSSTETTNAWDIVGVRCQALPSSGTNVGRNFRIYIGGQFTSQFNRSNDIDWAVAGASPRFEGGRFISDYNGTGALTATSSIRFIASAFFARSRKNPSSAVTLAELTGLDLTVEATVAQANMTITEASGIRIRNDLAATGLTVTRAYGIAMDDLEVGTSGATPWAINIGVEGWPIQTAQNTKWIFDGTSTVLGDTHFEYVSADSELVCTVDNTEAWNSTSSLMTIAANLRANGSFGFGVAPSAVQTGYTTFTNLSTDRTCDANATSTEELADILGTLIEDLKAKGIISA